MSGDIDRTRMSLSRSSEVRTEPSSGHEKNIQDENSVKIFVPAVQNSDAFNHNIDDGDDISYRETTEIMDISIGTLYQYVTQGILTPKKYPGRRPCFSRRYILEETARRRDWRVKRGWHR